MEVIEIAPLIDAVPAGGGSVPVVDNLASQSTTSALSANQGYVIDGMIAALHEEIEGIEVGTDAETLNGEAPAFYLDRANHTGNTPAANVAPDANHRFTTDAEKSTWDAKQNALGFTPVNTTDSRLSDDRAPLPHSHAMSDVTGLADALSAKANGTDVAISLAGKVDKITGKVLSTNDYTTAEKNKLAGLSNYDDTEIQASVSSLETDKPRYEVLSEVPGDLSGYPDGSRIIVEDE